MDLRPRLTPEDVIQGIVGVPLDAHTVVMASKENGDCMYLDRETGCTIWNRRPQVCQDFDCRNILAEIERNADPLLNIVIAAVRLTNRDS
jgi:Fe-S-cluster containining protein